MAEGSIVETFFESPEGGEGEDGKLLGGIDPIAAAIAIDAARFDPELSAKAGQYLDEQRHFTKIQSEHLLEQKEVQLSSLKLSRWSARLRLGLQFFLALVGTIIVCGVLTMLYDAFLSKNVVVSAFEAPPTLAARGVNGTVVATEVLDGLEKVQDATRGPSQGLKTRGAWTSDIKIEVPETGISIGEIDRLLHERFGHDVHIDGDLVQTATGGLSLTVRGDDVPAKAFAGGIDDLNKLTTQAAEYIYGRSQPWLYCIYLYNASRLQDIFDFVPGAFARAPESERANLANVWAMALDVSGKPGEAYAKYRLVIDLSAPRSDTWWKGWANSINELLVSRGEEAAWIESRKFLEEADRAPSSEKPGLRYLGTPALQTVDYPLNLKSLLADSAYNGGSGANSMSDGPAIADDYALMHDAGHADHYIAISDPDDPARRTEAYLLQAYAALRQNDPAAAIPAMEAYYKIWLTDPSQQSSSVDGPCFLGLAYGLSGRTADAETVFKRMGPWSRCLALHGDVLAHAGDTAGAMATWADGIRRAPDMPFAYLHRGLFEMAQGQMNAAQTDFATANAKAPHFADPLKAWGDLLSRTGHWKTALAKYDEALKYAPAWTELHAARDAAAKRSLT